MERTAFDQVVDAIAELGLKSFILLDRAEPEFKTFEFLLSKGIRPQFVALLRVCTGLIDYQLAEGGATRLWKFRPRLEFCRWLWCWRRSVLCSHLALGHG